MISGYKKPVTEGEIFQLNPREQSKTVIPRFEANWNKEKEKYRTVRWILRKGSLMYMYLSINTNWIMEV